MNRKYCANCEQFVSPTKGVNLIVLFLLLCFFFVPGIIYFFWKAGTGGKCPIYGGNSWGSRNE